jgi:hypothetical protein
MNWRRLMGWLSGYQGKHAQGIAEAKAAKRVVDAQAVQARKLTHSLQPERIQNHLGARIRLAMESRQDEP